MVPPSGLRVRSKPIVSSPQVNLTRGRIPLQDAARQRFDVVLVEVVGERRPHLPLVDLDAVGNQARISSGSVTACHTASTDRSGDVRTAAPAGRPLSAVLHRSFLFFLGVFGSVRWASSGETVPPHLAVGLQPGVQLDQPVRTHAVEASLTVGRTATSPASRSTLRCFDTAGWLIASSLDERADRLLPPAQLVKDASTAGLGDHLDRGGDAHGD